MAKMKLKVNGFALIPFQILLIACIYVHLSGANAAQIQKLTFITKKMTELYKLRTLKKEMPAFTTSKQFAVHHQLESKTPQKMKAKYQWYIQNGNKMLYLKILLELA